MSVPPATPLRPPPPNRRGTGPASSPDSASTANSSSGNVPACGRRDGSVSSWREEISANRPAAVTARASRGSHGLSGEESREAGYP